jgi:large subunit ribosomal protein L18
MKQNIIRRKARHKRIKRKVLRSNRPRMVVRKTLQNIFVQIVDDVKNITLVEVNTLTEDFKNLKNKNNVEVSKKVGEAIAKKALAKGIETVVFDRAGYPFHGKIKALADSAREAGLKF